jgi:hypothetical protein
MKIQTHHLDSEYYITSLPNFETFKKKLLKITDKFDSNNINIDNELIDYSDWNIPYEDKPYSDLVVEYLTPYLELMAKKLNCKVYQVNEFWFQRYVGNNFQNWHNHVGTMYTNILFIDLKDTSYATQFFDSYNNQLIQTPKLKEGDIITIPAHVPHRSIKIENGTKAVMSFNITYFDIKQDEINKRIKE